MEKEEDKMEFKKYQKKKRENQAKKNCTLLLKLI